MIEYTGNFKGRLTKIVKDQADDYRIPPRREHLPVEKTDVDNLLRMEEYFTARLTQLRTLLNREKHSGNSLDHNTPSTSDTEILDDEVKQLEDRRRELLSKTELPQSLRIDDTDFQATDIGAISKYLQSPEFIQASEELVNVDAKLLDMSMSKDLNQEPIRHTPHYQEEIDMYTRALELIDKRLHTTSL